MQIKQIVLAGIERKSLVPFPRLRYALFQLIPRLLS